MSIASAFSAAWAAFWDRRSWRSIGGFTRTTSREVVTEDTALNFSAVWAATKLLCGTGSYLPLPVYRRIGDDDKEKDRSHPLYDLLNARPNPEMSAFAFRSLMWQWKVNWGNAYAEVEREGNDPDGQIVSLWPVHPARVEVKRDRDTMDLYYEVRNENDGGTVDLEPWRMLHLPSIMTDDGISGRGVIQHARETIGAGIAAEKYGANWFGGAAVPRVVIEHAGNWNADVREAFRREWEEIHGGADGKRVAVLQGGATVKPLSLSAEDSQFLETRQFGVEEIARWYGVPPHLLQHLLRATFNNTEHLGTSFLQYSLLPWLVSWEQAIESQLLTADERRTHFVAHYVDGLMRGDSQSRSEYYRGMTSAAIMTRNEARRMENLPPVPGGDVFLVQGAMVPLADDGMPQSDFAGTSQPSTPVLDPPTPQDQRQQANAVIATRLKRVLKADLSRLLTKETKAVASMTKSPRNFIEQVDKFYDEHAVLLSDAISDTVSALTVCGIDVDCDILVAAWIREGRSIVIETAGAATPYDITDKMTRALESRRWTERPLRAIEELSNEPAHV